MAELTRVSDADVVISSSHAVAKAMVKKDEGGRPLHICYIPVSYTHLDVYKRQVLPLRRESLRTWRIARLALRFNTAFLAIADVYKRQGSGSAFAPLPDL